jgi:uracil-DNA glycosylase family protein
MARLAEAQTAAPLVPEDSTLDELKEAAAGCEACDLHLTGTQTVFGEGPARAKVMMVGEQPGDYEDRVGQPFVGPAGKLLDRALEDAGIDRSLVYVTNVVKHFKWTAKGKKRIHSTPNMREIRACRPWLDSEIDLVKPDVLVALGATAAKALLGPDFRVTMHRGEFVDSDLAPFVMATVHPSSILRAEDAERDQQMAALVADLAKVADAERQLH